MIIGIMNFFRFLPKDIKAENTIERDNIIVESIDSFGQVKECEKHYSIDKYTFLKPDLKWINHQIKL